MRKVAKFYAHLFPIWFWPSFHCLRLYGALKKIIAPKIGHNCRKIIHIWFKTPKKCKQTLMIIEIIDEALGWRTFIHRGYYKLHQLANDWWTSSICYSTLKRRKSKSLKIRSGNHAATPLGLLFIYKREVGWSLKSAIVQVYLFEANIWNQ